MGTDKTGQRTINRSVWLGYGIKKRSFLDLFYSAGGIIKVENRKSRLKLISRRWLNIRLLDRTSETCGNSKTSPSVNKMMMMMNRVFDLSSGMR